ncbi:unnamed protein product [Blepharisma stoltei]|uniref:Uncharacterized protein n=1 Tax=Blepharisma stoltei TaxID=1481888 RepID=A0AAU9IPY6_9CILI|nr:unnamed protein product [Blepharisma stoltei]
MSKRSYLLKPIDSSFEAVLPPDSPRSAMLPPLKFPDIYNAVISEAVSRSRSRSECPKVIKKEPNYENNSILSQAIDGIFKVLPQNTIGEVKAYDLVRLFISLKLSVNSKSIVSLFTVDENIPFHTINISKHHLFIICDDSYAEKTLEMLTSESKKEKKLTLNHRNYRVKNSQSEFDQYLATIRNIWDRIDTGKVGYLFWLDIAKHLVELGIVKNISIGKKLLAIFKNDNVKFLQFQTLFSKGLIRKLILDVAKILQSSKSRHISPFIAISTRRRKILLSNAINKSHNELSVFQQINDFESEYSKIFIKNDIYHNC